MDFLKNAAGNLGQQGGQQAGQQGGQQGGFNLGNTLNNIGGGGAQGEKNEDALDKGIDFVQERFMGQGPQDNENAIEQAKDKAIAGAIRNQWKTTTGTDFPIKEKQPGQQL